MNFLIMTKFAGGFTQKCKETQHQLYEKLGNRVRSWREHLPGENTTQADIEIELDILTGRLSKIEAATGATPSLYELQQLSKAMGITCDELITGLPAEHQEAHDFTGLSEAALKWLSRQKTENPDYINMLNLIFEDEVIVTMLLDSILTYANKELIQIHIGEIESHFPVTLRQDKQDIIIKNLALYYLQTVLEKVRNDWTSIVFDSRLEKASQKALEQATLPLIERLRHLDIFKEEMEADIEEARRRDNGGD